MTGMIPAAHHPEPPPGLARFLYSGKIKIKKNKK
jgi:hypothetical protein